jgi:tetratricopeptide (TPR) repeat protein
MAFQIRVLFALGLVSMTLAVGSGTAAAPAKPEDPDSQEALRAYLHLQEQLHATQLAIDQARRETRDSAVENSKALSDRIKPFSEHLREIESDFVASNAQHVQELRSLKASNETLREQMDSVHRSTIETMLALGVAGLLILFAMAYFQWRTVSGLTVVSAALIAPRKGGSDPSTTVMPEQADAATAGPAPPDRQLLNAIEQLEKRILEMERAVIAASPPSGASEPVPPPNGKAQPPAPEGGGASENAAHAYRIAALLGRGQSLLNLDNPEAAIGCFDELLGLDPGNAEALVKKGAALESLQKFDEAIECFDRAIVNDRSMTIAYLHKGGLYNRMDRFSEALQCYEQALKTQHGSAA